MADPVKASATDLVTISQQCHGFSEEVTGLLNGFSEEITYLLGGALQSPRIKEKLLEVQEQINSCKSKLNSTMQFVGDAFKGSADRYVQANETSESLVTHLSQSEGGGGGGDLQAGAAQRYDYTSLTAN
jgi:hypothetical protein